MGLDVAVALMPALPPASLGQRTRAALAGFLPAGHVLPEDVWARRHTFNLFVLAMHVPGLAAFALYMGYRIDTVLFEVALVGAALLLALPRWTPRSWRATVASFGLLTCSAVLVDLSGGYIEAHFHFFVMVPLIALYQDKAAFMLAFAYVVVHHGFLGTLDPRAVYNHPAAWVNPWAWAAIHGVFVFAACVASLFNWRFHHEAFEARETVARQRLDHERRANALRDQLLRTASHELKTPLTPLRLQVEMLQSGALGPLNRDQRRAVGMLDRNLDRLSELVRDVLDVARLQDGRLTLAKRPLDLREAAREAVETFRDLAAQRGVHVALRLHGPAVVLGDPNRLAQVLTNLLSNALKFTPAHGTVAVELGAEGGQAVLRVRDSGIGMTPEQLGRLFVPFGQVHETGDTAERGTGLGLFISKGIVEAHGGRLAAQSAGPGRGATFTVRLPLAAGPAPPPGTPAPARRAMPPSVA